ncbi:MAG: hypothetical protein H5U01_02265 [Clostridia bacterium]|nr:hypothetical protein [Clostridia bacterium]
MCEAVVSLLAKEEEKDGQATEKHLRWLAYLKWLGIKAEKPASPEAAEQGEG